MLINVLHTHIHTHTHTHTHTSYTPKKHSHTSHIHVTIASQTSLTYTSHTYTHLNTITHTYTHLHTPPIYKVCQNSFGHSPKIFIHYIIICILLYNIYLFPRINTYYLLESPSLIYLLFIFCITTYHWDVFYDQHFILTCYPTISSNQINVTSLKWFYNIHTLISQHLQINLIYLQVFLCIVIFFIEMKTFKKSPVK